MEFKQKNGITEQEKEEKILKYIQEYQKNFSQNQQMTS
jgi:hypothetical protein